MGAIAASFTDKSEPKSVIANGVKINGEKYMTIEASDDSLKAKKVRTPPDEACPRADINASDIGQGRRRRLQDNPGTPDCAPPRRHPDSERLQQRRRAGRVPQEGRILSGFWGFVIVHTAGIFAYNAEHDWGGRTGMTTG